MELASDHQLIFIGGISNLANQSDDIVINFIHLIDILYDQRVKLILSIDVEIGNLKTKNKFQIEFARTISRLHEMQSIEYISLAHAGITQISGSK